MSSNLPGQKEFEELWTIDQVAAYYKVHPKTVRRRLVELDIPIIRIGRMIRIRRDHVQLLAKKKW